MVGISIKNLLRVSGQGHYDLVAVFALPFLLCVTSPYCGMHGPSQHRAMKAIVIVIP